MEQAANDLKRIAKGGGPGLGAAKKRLEDLQEETDRLMDDLLELYLEVLERTSPLPQDAEDGDDGGDASGAPGGQPGDTETLGPKLPPGLCGAARRRATCGDRVCGKCKEPKKCIRCEIRMVAPPDGEPGVKGKGLQYAPDSINPGNPVPDVNIINQVMARSSVRENIHDDGQPSVKTPPDGAAAGLGPEGDAVAPRASASGPKSFRASPNVSPAAMKSDPQKPSVSPGDSLGATAEDRVREERTRLNRVRYARFEAINQEVAKNLAGRPPNEDESVRERNRIVSGLEDGTLVYREGRGIHTVERMGILEAASRRAMLTNPAVRAFAQAGSALGVDDTKQMEYAARMAETDPEVASSLRLREEVVKGTIEGRASVFLDTVEAAQTILAGAGAVKALKAGTQGLSALQKTEVVYEALQGVSEAIPGGPVMPSAGGAVQAVGREVLGIEEGSQLDRAIGAVGEMGGSAGIGGIGGRLGGGPGGLGPDKAPKALSGGTVLGDAKAPPGGAAGGPGNPNAAGPGVGGPKPVAGPPLGGGEAAPPRPAVAPEGAKATAPAGDGKPPVAPEASAGEGSLPGTPPAKKVRGDEEATGSEGDKGPGASDGEKAPEASGKSAGEKTPGDSGSGASSNGENCPPCGSRTVPNGGWKPAPRPKGVPENWTARESDTGGGTKFTDPANQHNSVRVMPGDPNSPYPNSQGPYVRVLRNGKYLDNNGNVVSKTSPEGHIPLNQFRGLKE
jgi:hypothetical protein